MFGVFLLAAITLVPSGHVNDFAGMISPAAVQTLEGKLVQFEKDTGNEIAVVTIPSLGSDQTIETYAEELFRKWGIGKEKEGNGVLLLISRDDREMRIEVGYGLEPVITDIESGHIISDVLVPAFQAGKYDEGVVAATQRIMDDIGRGGSPPERKPPFPWQEIIYIIIILTIIFINIRRKRQGKSVILPIFFGGGRGGKGGGFGGFGGGSSGGGGASGRW
ncbi:MAG: hypothetical protein A3J09_00885 [Candidatus Zambryskibacteria bacterium RIFCSPLOWO2_02_FULL_51_21]|uniref:TPM domain-containing protein n=1 Tax=Candidatus Zambryskibacteria bacterium RIFCSPHIGHO2_02_FULL_43_37 TaxID=1802749 RepID=A0A1G2THG9_9BACT|nr:MAG: hypothetical protein A2723_00885 [Candidatus Zambryskibacteria bacterium RIFCSPHIGHO2_01_FULL_52_18]OHA96754.1 MAG: hypothetical protein A3D49_02845 [Candidatus Zambryskibacteria bacterium RIFCSPHIGHO2_02_FULL_43_37]OHB07447.1 MAG: hypothetical protein A2944_01915 [Candidatus Zambryskibacteria bacterium RIFCSPLOWO2_01_FULL_52_12]OHB11110.1 MAG: hypothetical protein A3J09_00885 [Candidatus Zambryskibacteria bacterium RIFCSPLOWO2_02_FULL_51_21]